MGSVVHVVSVVVLHCCPETVKIDTHKTVILLVVLYEYRKAMREICGPE
jgi:hypothetical protein